MGTSVNPTRLPFEIDMPRLVADLRAVAEAIKAEKRVLGATWTGPMAEHQRRLGHLRWRATELCVLRARLRGRYHIAAMTPEGEREEYHATVAARVAGDYAKAPAQSAELAS